jgi:acyl-CoA thioester hydrolase
MARSDFTFVHRFRVRYAEVDAQAVAFNSRYLEYADIGLTEYWRAMGLSVAPGPETPEFHVARAVVDYRQPLRFDAEIDLLVRLAKVGRSSLITLMELHPKSADNLLAAIELVHVHVDLTTGKSQPTPADFIARFEAYEGRAIERK